MKSVNSFENSEISVGSVRCWGICVYVLLERCNGLRIKAVLCQPFLEGFGKEAVEIH
jgi:hypothetical protein